MRHLDRITTVAALAGALALCSPGANAQTTDAQIAKDAQELKAYVLTMDVLAKVAKAHKSAAAAAAESPAQQRLAKQKAELEVLSAKDMPTAAEQERMMALADEIARSEEDDGGGDQGNGTTITELARRIDATPAAAAAVRSAGLTSREYATALLALLEAGLVHEMLKQKMIAQVPPEASKRNVEFVRANEKQVAALGIAAQDGR